MLAVALTNHSFLASCPSATRHRTVCSSRVKGAASEGQLDWPTPSSLFGEILAPLTTMTIIAPRLFALIIGIDKYKDLKPNLSGAVADASAMMQFLSTKASAVKTVFLQNEGATRTAIIEGFRALQNWKEIEKDDPIVVYFAGHGSEARMQGDEECTQMLLPYDASPRTRNVEELPLVPGIPDHLIRDFLNDIAKAKGNNIVRIFTGFFVLELIFRKDSHIRLLPCWARHTRRRIHIT